MTTRHRILLSHLLLFLFPVLGMAATEEVAHVNDKVITNKDIVTALKSAGYNDGQMQAMLADASSKRQIISNLIDQELLVQEGEKKKLDQTDAYKDALALFRKQYYSGAVLEAEVGPKLTDSAIKKFHESNRLRYTTDVYHVQHILLTDEKQAREILAKAKAKDNGKDKAGDFQELAEKYSKDPSAKNNRGDIGAVTINSPWTAEFKEAVFAAPKGEVVGPIKTAYGYHIIKVVDKMVGKLLELAEVEWKVRADLKQSLSEAYINKLKDQAKIK